MPVEYPSNLFHFVSRKYFKRVAPYKSQEGSSLGYSATWKTLEEIVIEFRKKGITVPETVMTDLRSAKTLIKLMDAVDKEKGEMSLRVEQLLASIEGYLITEAQKSFPPERIDEWLERLNQASCEVCTSTVEKEEKTRFISGVPRDQKWMRVKTRATWPTEKLKELAEDSGLSYMPDKEDHIIVYGNGENIKEFVRKMTNQIAKA